MEGFIQIFEEYYANGWDVINILKVILDIYIVGIIAFYVFRFASSNIRLLKSFKVISVFLLLYIISEVFGLGFSNKIYGYVFTFGILIYVILYAPEIRHEIEVGKRKIKTRDSVDFDEKEFVNILSDSVDYLSRRKIGALITLEKDQRLTEFIEKAIQLDSIMTTELLTSIFIPTTPLHDGACIIRGNRVVCAGAYFPSTEKFDIPKNFGSRHRAGLGISEISDALTIIVSEETGNVSVTIDGVIDNNINKTALATYLEKYIKV